MESLKTENIDQKRVVVIMDACRDEDGLRAIGGFVKEFCLESGDTLTLVAVLHQVNSPSTFSIIRFLKKMGYRVTVDSGSMLGTNKKIVNEARARKELEYKEKEEIVSISKQCEAENIGFHVMVLAGKSEAVDQARFARATWVVLDKEMSRDKKMFFNGFSCGLARMKRHDSIEVLRPPKEIGDTKLLTDDGVQSDVFYDEMLPGSPKGEHSHHKSEKRGGSIHTSSSSERLSKITFSLASKERTSTYERDAGFETNEGFETNKELLSICSKCGNQRPKIGWQRDFSYAELYAATKGFSHAKFLSEGGFGLVYRGELKNGLKIAVKQHKNASQQGEREFQAEVHFLGTARHENLVMLLGSCSERSHRLLVYEYVCNGSLDRHLSKHARKPLTWGERMKIALGSANGIQYLHQKNIIHRDIRPNNILLTHDYNALLGDFGLARTQHEDQSSETRVVGALGYLAPEYAESGKVSTKTDVYAFGVILLQLITGRTTNDKSLGGKSLVGWARPLLKDRNYPDLIDPGIIDSHNYHQLFWMVRLAENCLSKDPYKRVTMDTVVYTLKHLKESKTMCNTPLDAPKDKDEESDSIETRLSQSSSYDRSISPRIPNTFTVFTLDSVMD